MIFLSPGVHNNNRCLLLYLEHGKLPPGLDEEIADALSIPGRG